MATTKTLYTALLAAQQDMPELQKNAINPHFKSKFISLDTLMEQILPILNKHELVLTQFPTYVGAGDEREAALTTTLTFAPTGESTEGTMLLCMAKNDPQGQGSAITYGRRYGLMAALGLVADNDDDGNAATAGAGNRRPVRRTKTESAAKVEAVAPGADTLDI